MKPAASSTARRARLWIVSELYYPEQTSTGYFVTRIAEGLASDMPIEVVSAQPTYSEHGMRAPRRETRHGVLIHRVRSTHFGKDRLVLRALNIATITISVGWFALTRFRWGDRLMVVTNPPTLPPVLGLIARMKGMRGFLLVHDVYPEVLVAGGLLQPHSALYRLLRPFFAATFRLFDRVLVLGRDMATLVARKIGEGGESRLSIIPNWGDPDEISPLARDGNAFLLAHRIDEPCVIQFSGNIGRTHDVETVLETAARLGTRADIRFVFVGYGGKAGAVQDRIDREGLKQVMLAPRQPREMLAAMLSSATATIISFVDGMLGLSVPSRMYNVMAAGVPIIALADPVSELSRTVTEEDAGWTLPIGAVDALSDLIAYLATPEGMAEAARRGANGRAAVLRRYTFEHVLAQYRELIEEQAGEGPAVQRVADQARTR